ncbi:hypothetical protein FACS1894110_26500 [Spirochaetia bacterium]|nr:hypothetical protein FACS1894110_26500 [Spirochaetia bacterium]
MYRHFRQARIHVDGEVCNGANIAPDEFYNVICIGVALVHILYVQYHINVGTAEHIIKLVGKGKHRIGEISPVASQFLLDRIPGVGVLVREVEGDNEFAFVTALRVK